MSLRYLPAILRASEGKMMQTVARRSLCTVWFITVSSPYDPSIKINTIPRIPKAIDEYIKTRVAIFCICIVYQG